MEFDLVIIGAGPGGYTCAIRAAQLGLKVAIVEKHKTLGGTCLNVGCIPSKALLESSEHFLQAKEDFAGHGIKIDHIALDLKTMLERKEKIVKELTSGVDFLMKKNKVERLLGKARLISNTEIEIVESASKKSTIKAKNIVLATGSKPIELPFLKFDGKTVISSTEALSLPQVPKHMIVVGGGVIGLELGSVWRRLGAKVTVIEFADKIASGCDTQMAQKLMVSLKKQGMEFLLSCKVQSVKNNRGDMIVSYENLKDNKLYEVSGDVILASVGRLPYSEGLGLEELGIEKDKRGAVTINDHFQTKFPNVYAIGDLVRGPMLAHKSEEEGVAVAEILAGQAGHVNYNTVPNVIYTWPELASVGLTEEQVKASGVEYKVGTFPFTPNARAKTMGSTDGLCKIIADKKTDKVLGVHIVGPRASDMIAEAVMAMEFSASSEDIARAFHAHPTLSEVMREAALNVDKLARQM